ncbi:MAG: pyruvate synthase, partial [Clostridia bacterium]|nr:pyruvate synthase [Clostridia bacterium]
ALMEEEAFLKEMESSYAHKFASKPEVIKGNMDALKMALEEVNG